MKIGRKKPNSKFTQIVYEFLTQQEPNNKVILDYVAKSLSSKIKMKAYAYIHEKDLTPFNYTDLLSIYPINVLTTIKGVFKFKDLKKTPEMFYKISRENYISKENFDKWNEDAKLLLESPYFEYYKVRLTYYRKAKKESKNESMKKLINNTPYSILANNAFESYIRLNKFSSEEIIDIMSKVNMSNTSLTNEIADSLMNKGNPLLIYNYMNSLGILNGNIIKTNIKSNLLEFVANYFNKRDVSGMMKAYASFKKGSVEDDKH
jgi:hypothetical protein